MAIKQDVTNETYGMTVTGAYIKMAHLRWSDMDKKVIATFSIWATPTAEAEGKACVSVVEIDVSHLYKNIQADAYSVIKSMPEYSNSVDV